MFEHILVPFDFGPAAEHALELGVELAGATHARLTVLHVCEIPIYAYEGMAAAPVDLLTPVSEVAKERLEARVRVLRASYPAAEAAVAAGAPHEQILAEAERRRCDLVVMGTHGRRGLAHVALGSVAEKVVRLSPVPVLTVHAHAAVAERAREPRGVVAEAQGWT